MTTPALAIDDPRTGMRFYRDPVTRRLVPSVTSVIGVVRSERLERWQREQVAETAARRHEELAERVGRSGVAEASQWLLGEGEFVAKHKARIGDEVHAWMEARAGGEVLPVLSEEARPWLGSCERFFSAYRPRVVATEATVFNHELGYAGTADLFCGVGSELFVMDYKTSRRLREEMAWQLAALAHADEVVRLDGRRSGLPRFDAGAVVWLRPGRLDVVRCSIGDEPFAVFRKLLAAWQATVEEADWFAGRLAPPA